jgi:protein-tyrosine phosphatase
MEAGVEEVRTALREAGVDCEVLPGGEVDLIELAHRDDAELLRLTLGGRGRCLLVEFPDDGWPPALESTIARLSALGVQTLLAHPERNSAVQERPALLRAALELGALVQVTAASVDGRLGRSAAATSRRLIREGFAHVLATDSHHPGLHREGVAAAAAEVGDAALVEHMTVHAPRALLGEGAMPPLPRVRRRRLPFNLSGN